MSPTLDAFLRSWPFAPWLAATLLISACDLSARLAIASSPRSASAGTSAGSAAFLGGLAAILSGPGVADRAVRVALAASSHAAAPAADDGRPAAHLARLAAVPAPARPAGPVRTYWVAPLLRSRPLRDAFAFLTHPFVAWPIYVGTTWLWHTPRGYELGLSQDNWHVVEHACFLASALLFWYPVVRPYPSRPRWSRWLLFPYLLLADVQNTVLAAWLTFSPVVLYPYYLRVPRLAGISALDDQATAGVLMWVPGRSRSCCRCFGSV